MAGSPLFFDFDFTNLIIEPKVSGTYEAKNDIYSDWKELLIELSTDPLVSGAPPAFDTVGGDPISLTQEISPYYFLRNDLGWRLKAPEEDGEVIINGNIFPRDSTKTFLLPTIGAFTQLMRLVVSPQSITENLASMQADLKLIKQLTGGNATVSLDDLTVTIFDEDGVTPLATYSISADARIRTRTS